MAENFKVLDESGYTSIVYYLPGDPPRACKSFNENRIKTHFPIEREAYERFSAHDYPCSILQYYGVHDSIPAGIILELAENQNFYKWRWDQERNGRPDFKPDLMFRWAKQAVQALEFAHSLGVYNSDIHPVNFFLDRELNLKVGDWAGASIDGSVPQSSYRFKYRLFDADGTDIPRAMGISARTEIFALGTALFYMITCDEPWPDLRDPDDRAAIQQRIQEKSFPDTSVLPVLGAVIWKCWNVQFTSMTEVKDAIDVEMERHTLTDTGRVDLAKKPGKDNPEWV